MVMSIFATTRINLRCQLVYTCTFNVDMRTAVNHINRTQLVSSTTTAGMV